MPTIIRPGEFDAASYNDDSSPDTRLTSNLKLSINAQVMPESSLEWYYRILQLCGSIPGELKSTDVWLRFQSVDEARRNHIWSELSKVRIHIVDPRPYQKSLEGLVRTTFHSDDPIALLRQQAMLKDPKALVLSDLLQIFIAESILSDSIGAQVLGLSAFVSDVPFVGRKESSHEDQRLSLDHFGPDVKPLVRKVSLWSAKSAATFHEALDCFMEFDESFRYFPNRIVSRRMEARVLKKHAFDKGDEKHIKLLQSTREKILFKLQGIVVPGKIDTDPYPQLNSAGYYLVQAADIAAGIASKVIETEHLPAVVTRFEYVTYNGRRVSMADMEEQMRRIRP